MRIKNLQLFNFQGIRDAKFDFDGRNANIYGDNATGKTTIFNAITWLLFDKSSTGSKNFTPKTKGPGGDLHYLEHGVEAGFILDDGQLLTLKKVYQETYTKKRGSTIEEFTGHSIDYYVDGVPTKEKEYIATLVNYMGTSDQIKMLLMPHYFSEEMPWDERRHILMDICGDVPDEDVIASSKQLADLLSFLIMPGTTDKHYTVDEYKKIASTKMKDINKELQGIPDRIDEAKKAIPDIANLDVAAIDKEISLTTTSIAEFEQLKRQIVTSGDDDGAKVRQVSALKNSLTESRAEHMSAQVKQNESIYKEISEVQGELSDLKNKLYSLENYTVKNKIKELEQMDAKRERLFAEYTKVSEKTWQGSEICPTCNQALPAEEVERAKEIFNLAKSKRLEEINTEGQTTCSKGMIANLDVEIKAISAQVDELKHVIERKNTLLGILKGKLADEIPFESTKKYAEIIGQISAAENSSDDSLLSGQVAEFDNKLAALRGNLDKLMADKSKIALAKQQEGRIGELSAQEKSLAKEYEQLQRGVYLCEEFVKAKVSMITDNINSKFETVRFRLFIEQINGGIKEDCEVMVPSENRLVPYAFANNAARINAGLEIINVLSKYYEISIPVFVDNAESVTKLIDIEPQVIRLVVSEQDKSLRLEYAD